METRCIYTKQFKLLEPTAHYKYIDFFPFAKVSAFVFFWFWKCSHTDLTYMQHTFTIFFNAKATSVGGLKQRSKNDAKKKKKEEIAYM